MYFKSLLDKLMTVSALIALGCGYGCNKSSETKDSAGANKSNIDHNANPRESTPSLSEEARRLLKEETNLEILSEKEATFLIQNKHSGIQLALTAQGIIDGKHKILAAVGPEHLKDVKDIPKPSWGKAPSWIYRYEDAEIQPGSMHAPMQDGSVVGSLSMLHSDDMETAARKLTEHYQALGMKINADGTRRGTRILTFIGKLENDGKSQITLTLSKKGETLRVSTQYSYGMP